MKIGDRPAPVLLFIGPEKWLKAQAIQNLTAQCIAPGFEPMDLVRFPEPPSESRLILEAARTPPFGSPVRLVVVDGIRSFSEASQPWLAEYCAHPNPKACVVLWAEDLEKGTTLPKSLQVVWCQPLKGRTLKEWILRQAQGVGVGLEPDAADLLIQRVGNELQTLALALESLSLLAGKGTRITRAHVEALIAPSPRETAFDILDTAASGRPAQSLGMLRQALAQGRLTVEHHFMGALGWYYRMAWKTKEIPVADSRVSPARVTALTRLARSSRLKLQRALEEVLRVDTALKRGSPAPELLADQLLLKLGQFDESAGKSGLGS